MDANGEAPVFMLLITGPALQWNHRILDDATDLLLAHGYGVVKGTRTDKTHIHEWTDGINVRIRDATDAAGINQLRIGRGQGPLHCPGCGLNHP